MGTKTRHARTPSITISPSGGSPPRFLLPEATTSSSTTGTPHQVGNTTPSSVGFVSLSSLNLVNGKLRRSRPGTPSKSSPQTHASPASGTTENVNGNGNGHSNGNGNGNGEGHGEDESDEDEGEEPVYLRWEGWLDADKYAVLPNDWPYNVPYGVRHYCVWSRVSLFSHSPQLVNFVVSPTLPFTFLLTPVLLPASIPLPSPSNVPSPCFLYCHCFVEQWAKLTLC